MKTKLLLSIFLFLGSYIVGAQINITPTINNVTCYNACDGSISLSISGGTPGYTYLWSNGYMTPLLSGVCAGMYTVTVTDATALQGIQTFTITQPAPLNISITSTNVLCNGLCDGTATTSISGGTPPYTYMWNNGNPTPEIIGICAGTYTLTITDANGCSAAHSVTITQPVALSSTITSTTNNICNGDCNGSATVSAFGGTPPFTYTWCNANTTNTCTNMCAGTCGVTTTDVNGCTVVTNVTITEPSAIVVTTNVTNASCTNNDGQIDVIPTGGVPPYNSVWSNGSNTNTITNLATGNYSVTTVDANGCSTSTFATLGFSSFPAILSGTANYSSGSLNAGDAVVNLFKENGSGSGNFDTISVQTLSSTGFYFNNLMPGLYHLSINLTNPSSYPNLLNTYYNNKFVWTDADTIILACSDTINLPVQMYEIVSSPGGNCNLSGTILYGNYTGFKNINAVGEPVPGAEILIEQEPNDVPIESAITDINGHYLIGNISTGNNYRLIVDIPGYPIISTYTGIIINPTDTLINNLNFLFDTSSTGGIYIDTILGLPQISGNGIISIDVYPNPFSKYLNINYNLSQNNDVYAELVSIDGKINYELLNCPNCKGNYNFIVSIPQNLPNGNYLVNMQVGKNFISKKIVLKK